MIQTNAPTLSASALQTLGMPASSAVPGTSGADFAALMGLTQTTVVVKVGAVMGDAAPPTQPAEPPEPTTLGDAVKGAQQGLAALALQAGAAVPRPLESTVPGGLSVVAQIVRSPVPLPAGAAAKSDGPALPATSQVAMAAVLVPPTLAEGTVTAIASPTQHAVPKPLPGIPTTLPTSAPKSEPATTALPMATVALTDEPLPIDGKAGKATGKILPSPGLPLRREPEATIAEAEPIESEVVGQMSAAVVAVVPAMAVAVQDSSVPLPMTPQAMPAERTRALAAAPMPSAPSRAAPSTAPRTAAIAPLKTEASHPVLAKDATLAQARAVKLEPIEIVAADASESPALLAAALPAASNVPPDATKAVPPAPVRNAVDTHAPAMTAPSVNTPAAMPPAEASLPTSAAPPARPAATPSVATTEQPTVQQAPTRAPENDGAAPASQQAPAAPAVPGPITRGAVDQADFAQPHADAATRPAGPAPTQDDGRPATTVEAEITPVAQQSLAQPDAQPILADAPMPTATPAPGGSSAPAPALAETPHDFDTLVSRLAEAREAASPNVVRTAMAHGEFGRVSMQLDHSDGGLSVTMASRDPEFTGAVQAAAAAMASNASAGSEQPRHDGSAAQQNNAQSQAQTGPQTNTNTAGQGPQARADASGQQPRREGGSFMRQQNQQQPGSPAHGRAEQRSGGGVYA
ncbi:hypothetical protein [Novosphingobium sp. AP12]|uniref:hypothetical protein n=1 Tax=Novosphingobium sp. AP12 TaxID=1144305 RepID=UPI000271E277|nr:hypothetical protein [Novosphingobium sp. AP12]EJL27083.1 hypothetical protein PMI02_02869 [Novosphingobium sp. AP12]